MARRTDDQALGLQHTFEFAVDRGGARYADFALQLHARADKDRAFVFVMIRHYPPPYCVFEEFSADLALFFGNSASRGPGHA
jgi:hypothetical protein